MPEDIQAKALRCVWSPVSAEHRKAEVLQHRLSEAVLAGGAPAREEREGNMKAGNMTEEEVRDFFEKLRSQRQELYDLIQEREHVANDIAAVKAVQYDKPKITVTVNSDLSQILERIIERCDKLDKRLLECMDILTSMRKKAYELLALCRDTKAKTILYDRYLAGMSWREIEEKRGFTRQWLNRMRDRAIRMISQNTS